LEASEVSELHPLAFELAAMLRAARATDSPAQRSTARRVAVTLLTTLFAATALSSHQVATFPHSSDRDPFLSLRGVVSPRQDRFTREELRMRAVRNSALVVGSSLAIAAGASAQDAVQWRVEDGGNGHWYGTIVNVPVSAVGMVDSAAAVGAKPIAINSQVEQLFLQSIFPGGWTLGLYANAGSNQFTWLGGEDVTFTNWGTPSCFSGPYPNNSALTERFTQASHPECAYAWDDYPPSSLGITIWPVFHVEWSADCNADGIVDYGQIRAGELADENGNNIPDCCEGLGVCLPCRADIDQSGAVNGVDLAAVLNNWGTSGGKQPRSDINNDGVVDGADLAEVLNSWGACP
jgi:hypothetical protein